MKWPGYLEDFDKYAQSSNEAEEEKSETMDPPFPSALHMYDLPTLTKALETLGFVIEFADYIDGRTNGAVKETWHDGREYVGIIARKP